MRTKRGESDSLVINVQNGIVHKTRILGLTACGGQ